MKNQLIVFLEYYPAYLQLPYCIYLLFYLAMYKVLPSSFYFGANYKKHLLEFTERTLLIYGCTSKPGIHEIINMASRKKDPNMFAQFSYAEMLYYGSISSIQQDIPKAYEYYKLAAGQLINPEDDPADSHLHPLALWSLACIFMDYHRKKPLENCMIEELDLLTERERLALAVRYAKTAYDLTGSAGAANTLGRLAQMNDSDIEGMEEIKEQYALEPAEKYFEYAAGKGYVYAFNNRALAELRLVFTDEAHAKEHLRNYKANLVKSAEQHEPWAANRLGEFYRTGTVCDNSSGENACLRMKNGQNGQRIII